MATFKSERDGCVRAGERLGDIEQISTADPKLAKRSSRFRPSELSVTAGMRSLWDTNLLAEVRRARLNG